jgi:predicted Rossmann-fold nucleotide-binding protein
METANRGASDAGAPSIGFNISFPAEQESNPYSTPLVDLPLPRFCNVEVAFADASQYSRYLSR